MEFETCKEFKMGEICDIRSSKRIYLKDYVPEGIPFYRSKEIILKHKNEKITDTLYITNQKFLEVKEKYGVPQQHDILLTSVGTLGVPYLVKKEDEFYFKDGNLTWFNNFNSIINPKYIYYWFLSPLGVQEIEAITIGSTQKALTMVSLRKMKLKIPSYATQGIIVNILSTLDDTIINNLNIISNLEQIAQTLFKQHLVDYEFPDDNGELYKSSGGEMEMSDLGLVPKEWRVDTLDKIANYQNGLAMQKFRPKNEKVSLPVLKIKELNQGFTENKSERCSMDIKESVKVYDGDVIFSWSGTLLVKLWVGGPAGLNQHLFKVSSQHYPKWFYYYWTKHHLIRFIAIAADKATTMGHINKSHLSESKVIIPPQKELSLLSSIINPILEEIISKGKENEKIKELRDNLLSKLLSGEIELADENEVKQYVSIS